MGIGPSTKETTLHNFRDPLLDVVAADEELDLMGVLIVGTPQDQQDSSRRYESGGLGRRNACGRRNYFRGWMGKQRCGLYKYNRAARETEYSGGRHPLYRNGGSVRSNQSVYGYYCRYEQKSGRH